LAIKFEALGPHKKCSSEHFLIVKNIIMHFYATMNSIFANHDPWDRYLEAVTNDRSIRPQARSHLARWVTRWQQAEAGQSVAATEQWFAELGRQEISDW